MSDFFISYSRKDIDFVQQLVQALEKSHYKVWVDFEDILPTAQWLTEIYTGIEGADNFVFVISPESITSQVCKWEVAHAVQQNKRLIPVLRREVDSREVQSVMAQVGWDGISVEHWTTLSRLNWIRFRENDDFDVALHTVLTAANMDLPYVQMHSRILVAALEWDRNGRKDGYAFRGDALKLAIEWLSTSVGKNPQPTEIQRAFVVASQTAARRRRTIVTAATACALFVIVAVGVLALSQFRGRLEQQEIAAAERQTRQVKEAESRSLDLAATAGQVYEEADPDLALALAVAAAQTDNPPAAVQQALAELAYRPGTVRVFTAEHGRFSPDGKTVLLTSNKTLILWNRETKQETLRFSFEHAIAGFDIAPDNRTVLLALNDDTLLFFDSSTSNTGRVLGTGRVPVKFQSQGENFLSTIEECDSQSGCVSTLVLRNTASGAEVRRFRSPFSVTDLDASQDGNLILAGLSSGGLRLWNAATGAVVHDLYWFNDTAPPGTKPTDLVDILYENLTKASVAVSPDGLTAASGIEGGFPTAILALQDSDVILWNLTSGEVIRRMKGHTFETGVSSVALSPDGRYVLSGGANELILWDVESGTEMRRLDGHRGPPTKPAIVFSVDFSPDGDAALSAASDGTIRLWDLTPGAQLLKVDYGYNATGSLIQALALSPDGKQALIGGLATARSSPETQLIDLTTGKVIYLFENHGDIYQLSFTPDAQRALEVSEQGLWLLDIQKGTVIRRIGNRGVGILDTNFPTQLPLASLSPDGKMIFADGSLWDIETGAELRGLDYGTNGIFSPDGKFVISSPSPQTLVVWEPDTGKELRRFSQDFDGGILAISGDGQSLLTSAGGAMILLDIQSGREIRRFVGHSGPVYTAAFSPNGKTILSGGQDRSVRLWDLATGQELRREWHTEAVYGVAFRPDGQTAVSASFDGRLVVWRMSESLPQLIDWVQNNRYVRELTCYERDRYQAKPLCTDAEYPWLGIAVSLRSNRILVDSVEPGSPAEKSGLQIGDEIRSIGDTTIRSTDMVSATINAHAPGDILPIEVYRVSTGDLLTFRIRLEHRPN